jgi:hypothetical protein
MTTKTGWPQGKVCAVPAWKGAKQPFRSQIKSSKLGNRNQDGTTMKIHSALDAERGRVVKMATVTSWDRFQAQFIWGIPVNAT